MRRAVVTGAAGFIGGRLTRKLKEMKVETVAIDILPMPDSLEAQTFCMDISETGALDNLLDCDTTVFHMASMASVPGSVKHPRQDFKDSLYGLFEIIESARKSGCKVLFPSTASIFDSSNELPVSERSYVKPSSPYAAAKAAGEAYCAAYHRCYNLDIRVVRMFSVYGIGMRRFAIHDMVRKIQKNNDELVILGDGNQIRDYLYIDDAVNGIIAIAEKGEPGEDYNLASGIPVRICDLAKTIGNLMGFPDIRIVTTGESFPGDVPKWFGDISKVRQLPFEPKVSLEEGLKRTIKWLKQN